MLYHLISTSVDELAAAASVPFVAYDDTVIVVFIVDERFRARRVTLIVYDPLGARFVMMFVQLSELLYALLGAGDAFMNKNAVSLKFADTFMFVRLWSPMFVMLTTNENCVLMFPDCGVAMVCI